MDPAEFLQNVRDIKAHIYAGVPGFDKARGFAELLRQLRESEEVDPYLVQDLERLYGTELALNAGKQSMVDQPIFALSLETKELLGL